MNLPSPAEQFASRGPVWTPERKQRVTQLWNAGLSASMIAAEMPGFSRNAILGAVHRMQLPMRATKNATPRTVYKRKPKVWKPKYEKPRATKQVAEPIPVPNDSTLVSLQDRGPDQCCYPIGEDEILYCGAQRKLGSSYCPWHHSRMFVRYKREKANDFINLQWRVAKVSA